MNTVDQFIEVGKTVGRRAFYWGAAASSAPYVLPHVLNPQILEWNLKYVLPKLGDYQTSGRTLIIAGIGAFGFITSQLRADDLSLCLLWGTSERIRKRAMRQARAAISTLYVGGVVSFGALANDLGMPTNNHHFSFLSAGIACLCTELCARGVGGLFNKIRKEHENPLILG